MKKGYAIIIASILACAICACAKPAPASTVESATTASGQPDDQIIVTKDRVSEHDEAPATETQAEPEAEPTPEPQTLLFRDVFGEEYTTVINPDIPKNPYSPDLFKHDGDKLTYEDDAYDCMLGVDVSHHQGNIDWQAVKEQGYEFVIIRIGYRGYGTEGSLNIDRMFDENYKQAKEAGLLIGVYFFAQAINEEEAEAEAAHVLQILNGRELDLPVVYDPESILDHEARTDNVTAEQFTKNTDRFCAKIKEAGYNPMIYSNMLWEAFQLDLSKLSGIPIWYADYEAIPQTPYDFTFWQYSNEGKVNGISGSTDLDIWLRKRL